RWVAPVPFAPSERIRPGHDFLVTDQLAHEGGLFHPSALGTLRQNALLFLGETNGEYRGHGMTFVCLCFHSSSAPFPVAKSRSLGGRLFHYRNILRASHADRR